MTHPSQRLRRQAHAPQRQQGAALIITVLLMLVISTLALTAMVRNNMDERMAFNQRDRQNAFQAAEAALREAEEYVAAAGGPFKTLRESDLSTDCSTSKGACRSLAEPQWKTLASAAWTDTSTSTLALGTHTTRGPLPGVVAQPRYLIEYQGTNEKIDNGSPCLANFLITARGVGLNANSVVTLQSVFRWSIGACYEEV